MSDRYQDHLDREDEDTDGDRPFRHPIDQDDKAWRDEQYGRVTDPRRLAAMGLLEVKDDWLTLLQDMMKEAGPLALAHFAYAREAGNSELAGDYIKNAVSLAGSFARLLDRHDARLKDIGRSR